MDFMETALNRINRAYLKGANTDKLAREVYRIIANKPTKHTAYYQINNRYKVLDRAYKLEHMSV